jgi:hypothetical protein
VTKIIFLTFVNLVTPKAGAKHKLLFNKQHLVHEAEAGLLNKCSCLARALGVTKVIKMILVTLCSAT